MKIRTLVVTIKGDDLKAVTALEEHFSDTLQDALHNFNFTPRLDENGDPTGVMDLWGCSIEFSD